MSTQTLDLAADPAVGRPLQNGRFYRPELDVLRFFAFFGVFLFHASPRTQSFYESLGVSRRVSTFVISVLGTGAYGVDLFFALSAYLITCLLIREREKTGKLDLSGFYIRRILRIWPLYLTFVALSAIVARFSHTQHLSYQYVLGYTLLVGNWIYVFHGMPASFATPLWTVSIEEQFYLLWPLACRRVSRTGMATIAIIVLIVANCSRMALAYFGASIQVIEFNTISRVDAIALGILLALFAGRLPKIHALGRYSLIICGLLTWIGASEFTGSGMVGHVVSAWSLVIARPFIAIASMMILLGVLGFRNQIFANPILIYCGKISYGLYVIHEFGRFLAAYFIHALTPATVLWQDLLALGFTLLLATASYHWLEMPFLKLKERFAHVSSRPV